MKQYEVATEDALSHVWTDLLMTRDGDIAEYDRHNCDATISMLENAARQLGIELVDKRESDG